MNDRYKLQRFVDAQDKAYAGVVAELARGRKSGHWIWFVFPQIAGLGRSRTSRRFAIASLDEARAYADHPVLGPRLRECIGLVLDAEEKSAEQILGHLDAMKLRSCLTLFALACNGDPEFGRALERLFDGEQDQLTLRAVRQE